jgi:hypothetical protein
MAKIFRSSVINAPIDEVWVRIRDFNARPVTDGHRTYAEWAAEFDCCLEEEDGLVKTIGDGVFQGRFDALKTAFAT